MTSHTEDNKRIAKNTVMLYLRMFLIMGVSLYTSRVVLQVLGVTDYGIYNVVGGVVSLFSFIHSAMTSATQRYITFALGKEDQQNFHNTFCTSLNIHSSCIGCFSGNHWFVVFKCKNDYSNRANESC